MFLQFSTYLQSNKQSTLYQSYSENKDPEIQEFIIIFPLKWLCLLGYTPFSDKPKYQIVVISLISPFYFWFVPALFSFHYSFLKSPFFMGRCHSIPYKSYVFISLCLPVKLNPIKSPRVNYNISLSWNKAIWGVISLTNHDTSEVAVRSL